MWADIHCKGDLEVMEMRCKGGKFAAVMASISAGKNVLVSAASQRRVTIEEVWEGLCISEKEFAKPKSSAQ